MLSEEFGAELNNHNSGEMQVKRLGRSIYQEILNNLTDLSLSILEE